MIAPSPQTKPVLTLGEFYEAVFKPKRLAKASADACRQYATVVAQFERFLGRSAMLADLTAANVGAWARAATEFGMPHQKVRRRRDMLVAIKTYAARTNAMAPEQLSVVGAPILLRDFVDVYIDKRNLERPIGREVGYRTRQHLDDAVRAFSSWLNRPASVEDLTADVLNRFLADHHAAGKSPYTVKNRRTGLMVLLRRAVRLGLAQDVDARDVRSVHCPKLKIDGYSEGDMQVLIGMASRIKGVVRKTGIGRATYFVSAMLTMWNLGSRPGDIIKIRVCDFDPRGFFWVVEQKTGKGRTRVLQPATRCAIAACISIDPRRELIWPGLAVKGFYKNIKRIAELAGLPGTSRWIRRGAASLVENKRAGSAWKFLNHSVPSLFEKHYRVERLVDPDPIAPPEVAVPEALADHPQAVRPPLDPAVREQRWEANKLATRRCRERKAQEGGAA